MSERKPAEVSWRSWIDGQIARSRAEGEFDALPGFGKPIPDLDKPYDELWWVRQKMSREGFDWVPEPLQLRREVERFLQRLETVPSQHSLQQKIDGFNERIQQDTGRTSGVALKPLRPLDPEEIQRQWVQAREEARRRPRFTPSGPLPAVIIPATAEDHGPSALLTLTTLVAIVGLGVAALWLAAAL